MLGFKTYCGPFDVATHQALALGLKAQRSLTALILDENDIADDGGEAEPSLLSAFEAKDGAKPIV